MKIASRIRQLRQKTDLTQEELADRLGISRQSLNALEAGRCVPSVELALRVAETFNLPIDAVFWLTNIHQEIESQKGDEIEMPRGIAPWSPWRDMLNLRSTVERLFEDPVFPRMFSGEMTFPAINVRQTEKSVIVEADVPGVKEDEIDIEVHPDAIILRGQRTAEEETKEEDYYHREVSYGSFSRAVALPAEVKPEKATADLKTGTLTITLEKAKPKAPRRITLKPKAK